VNSTTVVGLITNNDKTAHREEVRALKVWFQENNFSLNVNKTKEMTTSGNNRGGTPLSTLTVH
jgi:hypothetical protein